MKKLLFVFLVGLIVLGGTALARKSPYEIFYPVTVETLGEFITDMDYKWEKITTSEGAERINLRIKGENGVYDLNVLLFDQLDIVYIYVGQYLSLPLNDEASGYMLSYLMNQNWNLTFGKFEWDIEDGEVRYSHTLPVDDGMSKETFQAYVNTMLNVADDIYPDMLESLESFRE
ncbi:MAG: YbjN domain-containing protein [bacterium]